MIIVFVVKYEELFNDDSAWCMHVTSVSAPRNLEELVLVVFVARY